MSIQDRIKSFFDPVFKSAVTLMIVQIALLIGAGAIALVSEWEDIWWATGLFGSLMINILLIQWANWARLTVVMVKDYIKLFDEQLKSAQDDANAKNRQIEKLNDQTTKDRDELDQLRSKMGERSTTTELKYVNMVVCDEGEFKKDPIVIVSLGHSDSSSFHYDNTSLVRFALRKHTAGRLCGMLAGTMGWSFKPLPVRKSTDEVEITDDDIPF